MKANMTVEQALKDYAKCLNIMESDRKVFENEQSVLRAKRDKMEKFLLEQAVEVEQVPEVVYYQRPFIAWKLTPKTDYSVVKCQMEIDDRIIPEVKNKFEPEIKDLKEQLDALEGWTLRRLQESGAKSFKIEGVGTASIMKVSKYSINDKALFIDWAVDKGVTSELTVSVRPNSKFMAAVVEETGELPQGISAVSNFEVRFTKA